MKNRKQKVKMRNKKWNILNEKSGTKKLKWEMENVDWKTKNEKNVDYRLEIYPHEMGIKRNP